MENKKFRYIIWGFICICATSHVYCDSMPLLTSLFYSLSIPTLATFPYSKKLHAKDILEPLLISIISSLFVCVFLHYDSTAFKKIGFICPILGLLVTLASLLFYRRILCTRKLGLAILICFSIICIGLYYEGSFSLLVDDFGGMYIILTTLVIILALVTTISRLIRYLFHLSNKISVTFSMKFWVLMVLYPWLGILFWMFVVSYLKIGYVSEGLFCIVVSMTGLCPVNYFLQKLLGSEEK